MYSLNLLHWSKVSGTDIKHIFCTTIQPIHEYAACSLASQSYCGSDWGHAKHPSQSYETGVSWPDLMSSNTVKFHLLRIGELAFARSFSLQCRIVVTSSTEYCHLQKSIQRTLEIVKSTLSPKQTLSITKNNLCCMPYTTYSRCYASIF